MKKIKEVVVKAEPEVKVDPEQEKRLAQERQEAIVAALKESYIAALDDSMGKLHNQFVAFISSANIPLPQVLLVLDMLRKETVDQAFKKYLGE